MRSGISREIILNRWGHAYLNPQPGFFFGKSGKPAPSDVLRAAPFGRIAFREYGSGGDHGSPVLDPGGESRSGAVVRASTAVIRR